MSEPARVYPEGEYAIVELFGHITLVGRIAEVERFGTKMMVIEPLFRDELLSAIFHGGAAIYRLTPCSAATAYATQPREAWQLPGAIKHIVPPALLEAPTPGRYIDSEDQLDDDDEDPFDAIGTDDDAMDELE